MKTILASLVGAALLASSACTSAPSASSPTPTVSAIASPAGATAATDLTPLAAADLLRKATTGTRPLLLPNTIPDSWRADVKVESAGAFIVTYREPARTKSFTLMVAAANPPLPGAAAVQTHPAFHGDASALYQVADATDPRSDRFLMWVEAGVWPGWPRTGVPYLVSTTGITDAEFWQLANGLHPDQIGG